MVDLPLRNVDEEMGRTRVRPAPRDSRLEKWVRWQGAIDRDLTDLAIHRMAWRTLTEVWEQRDPPLPGSFLFAHFGRTYAQSQAVGLRRQADVDPDVQTLGRLLSDVVDHPEPISRRFIVGRYQWGHQWLGENYFQGLDPGGTGHVDPVIVQRDLDQLRDVVAPVALWVNRRVAHLSTRRVKAIPKFSELDEALSTVEETFLRWTTILTGAGRLSLEPVPQYDWVAPLRVPWIL